MKIKTGDCEKCGHDDINLGYEYPRSFHGYNGGTIFYDEYFRCTCKRCQYVWLMDIEGQKITSVPEKLNEVE